MGQHSERHPKILRHIVVADGDCDLETLATVSGVSTRTIRRDIEELRALGIPIEDRTNDHGRKTYYLDTNAVRIKFTYDEATALLWACDSLRSLDGTSWGESIAEAMEKILAAIGPRERSSIDKM